MMGKSTAMTNRVLMALIALFACMLIALSGCQSSSGDTEKAEDAAAADTAASSSDAPDVGFVVPVKDAADAVWKVDYVNDDLDSDFVHDNWRMSIDPFPEDKIAVLEELGLNTDVSREGMDTLQTMGGADFTAKQFDWILDKANEEAGVTPDKLTVMDLRGESHGLIDGNVFCWWISNNFVNEGKTTAQVLEDEAALLDGLKAQDTVEMYETDDNWSANTAVDMLQYDKPEIMTEEDLVTSKGVSYVRFATTNHFRPDDGVVDEFVDYMNALPEDQWIYMHCYAGEGRTTCFMVMADIFKNYDVASFDDIAARQGLIGPVDVRTEVVTTGKSHYKMKASIERRMFLQHFYDYAQETGFQGKTWTEYAKEHHLAQAYYID